MVPFYVQYSVIHEAELQNIFTLPFQPNILQEDHNSRNGEEMTFYPCAIVLVYSFPRYWCTDHSSRNGHWDIVYGQSLAFRRVQQDIVD